MMLSPPPAASAAIVAIVGLFAGCSRSAPPLQPTRQYVATLGTDTVQIDEITFEPDGTFRGTSVRRVGGTLVDRFEGQVWQDRRLAAFSATTRVPGGTEDVASVSWTLLGDSNAVETHVRGKDFRQSFPERRWVVPMFARTSLVQLELGIQMTLPRTRNGSVFAGAGDSIPVFIDRREEGLTTIVLPTGSVRIRMAGDRIESADATGTTLNLRYDPPASPLDLEELARHFAALDAQGKGLEVLSPSDSVTAQFGGATVAIRYARPSRRGRVIFGSLVPWGEVWRTGANAATTLTSTNDLEFGETVVPAGTYSLWSIPLPDRWELILNGQTGQWGTEYDPRQDVARIPIPVRLLDVGVEMFTITLEGDGEGGAILGLEWDDFRAEATMKAGRRR